MGDIWPCGPPSYATWQEAYNMIYFFTHDGNKANIMAAIGQAESALDLSVINDTPATGDYSVGVWQINYYGGLYASRAAQFGTPCQLVRGGLGVQARAALAIQAGGGGYNNWTTYTSGAYRRYLHGGVTPGAAPAPQAPNVWASGFDSLAVFYFLNVLGPDIGWAVAARPMPAAFWTRPGKVT